MSPSLHVSQYSFCLHIGMGISNTVVAVALLTCCVVTGCEAFGLYPYPSLFGFVPPPLAPRNPTPRNTTPTPRAVTPDANPPPNTPDANTPPNPPDTNPPPNPPDANPPPNPPDANPPPNPPDTNPPPNTPDANPSPNTPDANPSPNPPDANPPPNPPDTNPPPNTPDANPPPNTPDANPPPNTPDANPPQSVPSYSPNGGSNYPFYGRGTQRTLSPFPGRSGWGGFVNRYKPPPPPPETPGFQYTPSVPPDTAQDSQDFVEPHREWVYHYRGTKRERYPERMLMSGYEKAISRNMIDNLVPYSETVLPVQEKSQRDEVKHYPLTSMINHLSSSHTPSEIRSVSDPSTHTGTTIPIEEHQDVTYPEQPMQSGTEFIDGETKLPTSGSKSTPSGKPVFPNASPEEADQAVFYGEPVPMAGRSHSTQPVAEAYIAKEEQVSDWAPAAPFAGSNQPFLIEDTLISLFGPRYPEGGDNAMV